MSLGAAAGENLAAGGGSITQERLKERVKRARQEAKRGFNSRLTRHWADLLAALSVLTLLAGFAMVLAGVVGRDKPRSEPQAVAHLPAFSVLQARHMTPLDGKADSLRKKLAGRYLLRPVLEGSPVRPADVGPATVTPALLQERHVLTLQLPAGAAPDSLRPGAIVALLLSPATPQPGATPAFVQRVLVLAASPAGEGMRVVVAVDRAQLDALAPRIGTSRVFVLTGGGGAPAAPATARDTGRTPADSAGG